MNNCQICHGPLVPMGTLGTARYARCRNCGSEHRLPEGDDPDPPIEWYEHDGNTDEDY